MDLMQSTIRTSFLDDPTDSTCHLRTHLQTPQSPLDPFRLLLHRLRRHRLASLSAFHLSARFTAARSTSRYIVLRLDLWVTLKMPPTTSFTRVAG